MGIMLQEFGRWCVQTIPKKITSHQTRACRVCVNTARYPAVEMRRGKRYFVS